VCDSGRWCAAAVEDLESERGGVGGCERACGSTDRRSSKGGRPPPPPPPPEELEFNLGLSNVRRLRSAGGVGSEEPLALPLLDCCCPLIPVAVLLLLTEELLPCHVCNPGRVFGCECCC
jgi:hypothetical protein